MAPWCFSVMVDGIWLELSAVVTTAWPLDTTPESTPSVTGLQRTHTNKCQIINNRSYYIIVYSFILYVR